MLAIENCGSKHANINSRTLFGLALCADGLGFAIFSFAATPPKPRPGSAGPHRDWSVIDPSAGRVQRGLYRGKPVTYVMNDGKAIFQGDIILEKVDAIDAPKMRATLNGRDRCSNYRFAYAEHQRRRTAPR
jgi:hypothetical protein